MGGTDRIGGTPTPDYSQVVNKKAAQPGPAPAQTAAGNAAPVDTTNVSAPKAADPAPVIAKLAQPAPATGTTGVATRVVSMVDPIRETAKKVLAEIKEKAGGLWHSNPDRYQDGLGNTR